MGLVLPLIKVPGKVDHTPAMTPFRDQGDEGTCVAFASAVGVKEYEDTRECKKYSNLKIPGARAGATRVMDILSMNISNVIAPTPGARRI